MHALTSAHPPSLPLAGEDVNSPWAAETVIATQAKPSQRLIDLYFPASNGDYTYKNHSAILAQ